jgi:uroporphyrinogen-III synthase
MDDVLKKKKILVTRPQDQAEKLCALIEQQGGQAIRLPVIEIRPVQSNDVLQRLLSGLSAYQIGIFISRNAVKFTLALLNHNIEALKHLQLVATGQATASLLKQSGIVDVYHAGYYAESEALLELPVLQSSQVTGRNIIIFRGTGGRELLAEKLRARGARVDYAEIYERQPIHYEKAVLDDIWFNKKPDFIVASSGEGLQNLFDMLSSEQQVIMLDTDLVVLGKRMSDLALKLGFRRAPSIADEMSDAGLFRAIMQHTGEKFS